MLPLKNLIAPGAAEHLRERELSDGLDYYKPTMSQRAYDLEPDAVVTFTFHNRGEQRLLDYVDPDLLQTRLDAIRTRGWTEAELDFLASQHNSAGQARFRQGYLEYLAANDLPPVTVRHDTDIDDIAIDTTGPWALATFWETVVMSEVNEAYFENYLLAHGLDPHDVYTEGNNRLSEKIAILQANPDIQFADFGTRRHFSYKWQAHVVERLLAECPGNFVGTSNVGLARRYGVRPIGTFAHEMPMVYGGLADARGEDIGASHYKMLEDWYAGYGYDLSIALPDTFTSDFFFREFTKLQAETWRGVRHDSGDAFEFGERLIKFYSDFGIDARTKTVVFSDGLDIHQIVSLQKHFAGRINILFGWGTTLTNDLGPKALNIVMKATHVRTAEGTEADLVKFSDDSGKHTGPPEKLEEYRVALRLR